MHDATMERTQPFNNLPWVACEIITRCFVIARNFYNKEQIMAQQLCKIEISMKDIGLAANICIKQKVFKHSDASTEDELCVFRKVVGDVCGCDLSSISLTWLRNKLVKWRKLTQPQKKTILTEK